MADKKAPDAEAASKGKGFGGQLVQILLVAIVSGGAAFAGVRLGGMAPKAAAKTEHPPEPPGPTINLEPFIVTVFDATGKVHAMKVTLAVEFTKAQKEDGLKALVPRIRDSALGFLRTLTFEMVSDQSRTETTRNEMLAHFKAAGAAHASRVLITDFVLQ